MEYNQLKQYGVAIHEDTPDTSTPVARMIPSLIDAKYAKLFLASKDLYEACKLARHYLESRPGKTTPRVRGILNNLIDALSKVTEGK